MAPPPSLRIDFALRETAGSIYLSLESSHGALGALLGCEAVHLHLRDGVSRTDAESLARELNRCVEALVLRPAE